MKKEVLSDIEIKFIETFVKKSTRYLLEKPKEVAAICKVSVYQVNKCFSNKRFMDKLDRGMNKKVLESSQIKSDANQKQQIKILKSLLNSLKYIIKIFVHPYLSILTVESNLLQVG